MHVTPQVVLTSRTYPVEVHYLEDVLAETGYTVSGATGRANGRNARHQSPPEPVNLK